MQTPHKAAHLQIRASEMQKAKLAQAARARHMNISQFVLSTSLSAADEVLAEQSRVVMGSEAYDQFCKLLDEEPAVLPALREQFLKLNSER